ncbi:MAG: hypothetical protein JHC40_07265, partial [Burkholderiales bacterium]|nr:hypothetical protein [Burkholderiales bacterium]
SGTDRGYTGHEHLDDIGLIHMNGRIFDPRLGVFLQGDPFIQDPTNLQNYNRYGYCLNNPMTCTDPSGFSFWKSLLGAVTGTGKSFLNAVTGRQLLSRIAHTKYGYMVGSIVIGVASLYCEGAAAACNGAGQAAWAGFSGRSFGESVKTGVIAGATSYAFTQVGDWTTSTYADGVTGETWTSQTTGQHFANVAGHAAVGCASAAASGGSCSNGAISAGVSAAYTNVTDGGAFKGQVVMGTIEHAMLGGFASVASGGKFADGAQQGAFGYLFNQLQHLERGNQIHELFGAALSTKFGPENVRLETSFSWGEFRFRTDVILFNQDVFELKPSTYQLAENSGRYYDALNKVLDNYVPGLNAKYETTQFRAGDFRNYATNGNMFVLTVGEITGRPVLSVTFFADPARRNSGLVFYRPTDKNGPH